MENFIISPPVSLGEALASETEARVFKKYTSLEECELTLLKNKVEKLKQLLLLTDPCVGHVVMNEVTHTQWLEFIKAFPDEGRF